MFWGLPTLIQFAGQGRGLFLGGSDRLLAGGVAVFAQLGRVEVDPQHVVHAVRSAPASTGSNCGAFRSRTPRFRRTW